MLVEIISVVVVVELETISVVDSVRIKFFWTMMDIFCVIRSVELRIGEEVLLAASVKFLQHAELQQSSFKTSRFGVTLQIQINDDFDEFASLRLKISA